MAHTKPLASGVIVCCLLGSILCYAATQERHTLTGRVALETKNTPPRLTVRLYPPRTDNRPPVVTFTDRNGAFKFIDLNVGRYLLEVYQGDRMVYQIILVIDRGRPPRPIDIKLKAGS